MTKCCIKGCNSDSRKKDQDLSFFCFPNNKALRQLWFENIGLDNIKALRIIRICSKHFEEKCINRTLQVIRLKDDVVPSLFLPTSTDKDEISIDNKLETNPKQQSGICEVISVNRGELTVPITIDEDEISIGKEIKTNPKPTKILQSRICEIISVNRGKKTVFTNASFPEIDPLLNNRDDINPIQLQGMSTVGACEDLYVNGKNLSFKSTNKKNHRTQALENITQLQRKKIKILNQKCRRLTRKVQNLKNIVNELKKQNSVSKDGA